MREIDVEGVMYSVSGPTEDPSRLTIWLGDEVVGHIVRSGDRYRLLYADGTPTNFYEPRTPDGIKGLVRTGHFERHAR